MASIEKELKELVRCEMKSNEEPHEFAAVHTDFSIARPLRILLWLAVIGFAIWSIASGVLLFAGISLVIIVVLTVIYLRKYTDYLIIPASQELVLVKMSQGLSRHIATTRLPWDTLAKIRPYGSGNDLGLELVPRIGTPMKLRFYNKVPMLPGGSIRAARVLERIATKMPTGAQELASQSQQSTGPVTPQTGSRRIGAALRSTQGIAPATQVDLCKLDTVIAGLKSGQRDLQRPILEAFAQQVDDVQRVQDDQGLGYMRYKLASCWRLNCGRVAGAIASVAGQEDGELRRLALRALGKAAVLEYRNSATVLLTAGASMQKHAREQQEYSSYGEDAGLAARVLGEGAQCGVKFAFERSLLVEQISRIPKPVADAVMMLESRLSEEAVTAMINALSERDAELRGMAVEGLGLILRYTEHIAAKNALEQAAANAAVPDTSTAARATLTQITHDREVILVRERCMSAKA